MQEVEAEAEEEEEAIVYRHTMSKQSDDTLVLTRSMRAQCSCSTLSR